MTTNTSSGALNVAINAALEAGKYINQQITKLDRIQIRPRKGTASDANSRLDLVSDVDLQAEQIIIDALSEAYGDCQIDSREAGQFAKGEGSDYVWLIEPMNGGLNFYHGHPHCAVGLAMLHNDEAQLAVVYDPFRNELYSARNGGGAQLDGRRLRVSQVARLPDALLCTSLPSNSGTATKQWLKSYAALLPRAQGIHQNDAPLLDLMFVASGRYDGYWSNGLSRWESEIGSLIVREAGGLIEQQAEITIAGTAKVQEKLRFIINAIKK